MNVRLIALAGRIGVGKDTVADYFVEEFGFVKMGFADPLKRAVEAIFGWSPVVWDDRVWRETPLPNIGKTPRQLLQTLGTEWGREMVHPDLWAWAARDRIQNALDRGNRVVISDCRFNNEAIIVHALGGRVVGVIRSMPDEGAVAHKSEVGLNVSNYDGFIHNIASIDRLKLEAEKWLS